MKKLVLLILGIAAVAMLVPQSRARVLGLVAPLANADRASSAERALKQIAVEVQRSEARTGIFPQPATFGAWLTDNAEEAKDPWGAEYYLEVYADSFVVASAGADSQRRSQDDIRVVRSREPTAAGMGSAFQPPAPPSSGVKSSAIRKAKEAAGRKQ